MVKAKEMVFECKENCSEKAVDILRNLEAELGVKLHIEAVGDEVHGAVSTSFSHITKEGVVVVTLYEEEEQPTLLERDYDAMPEKVKAKSKKIEPHFIHKTHTGHLKPHGLTEDKIAKIEPAIQSILASAKKKK